MPIARNPGSWRNPPTTARRSVAAALLLGLGLSTWLWLQERKAHDLAVQAELKAREAETVMAEVLKRFIDGQITRTVLPREKKEVWMAQTNKIPCLAPPGDPRLNGRTYEQWAAAWWQWALQMPLTNSDGAIHPFIDSPRFNVAASQASDVWFLAAPFLAPGATGTIERRCQIPAGTALFFPLFAVECSSIEAPPFYGATAEAQAAMAQSWAELIVDLFCELDRAPLSNLDAFRAQSPQININVPAPWILGKAGGKGASSGDGYFVFLAPLSPGVHTLHFGGAMVLTKGRDPTPADQRWFEPE